MSPLPIRGCDADQARKTHLLSVCLLACKRPHVRWHQIISNSHTNKIKKKKKMRKSLPSGLSGILLQTGELFRQSGWRLLFPELIPLIFPVFVLSRCRWRKVRRDDFCKVVGGPTEVAESKSNTDILSLSGFTPPLSSLLVSLHPN